jgi:hypothetical protein
MEARFTLSVIKTGGPVTIAPIEMWVRDNELGLQISLDDFLIGLTEGVGTPNLIFTKASLLSKMKATADQLVTTMKMESRKAVA